MLSSDAKRLNLRKGHMSTIELTNEYAKQHMGRAVPGAYFDRDTKAWVLTDPTPRAAAVALRLFPDLSLHHPELEELRDLLTRDVRPFDNATAFNHRVDAPSVRDALRREAKEFYDFQAIDLGYVANVLSTHGGAYIGWERGLGKTLGACALIDELNSQRTLVVAPNTAKRAVWEPELRWWLSDVECIVLRNAKAQRANDLGYVQQLLAADLPFVLVAHYEALAIIDWKKPKIQWDLVIADEAHRIKNAQTKMARALKRVPATYKVAMSGSIIQNHAEELFSPLQWLFPERYRSKWRDWNDRYLDYVETNYSRVCVGVKIERLEEMRQELGVFMVYRRKEDELDLPDKTEQTLMVSLLPAQRRAYDELLATCTARLADGTTLKAPEGMVMLGKLRQVATGLDLVSEELSDSSKIDLAFDLCCDSEEPTVVFSWYKAAGRALQARLEAAGVAVFLVDGDVPHTKRAEYIEAFQAGEGQVFIGTLSTLGESVTLHRAANAIFLDRSWNPAVNVQAEDRIYRIGQDKPVTITYIVARDTVDELRVTPAVANKEALRRLILGGK